MAHSVIERPAAFCMSKNEIRYVLLVTDLTRTGLYLEAQLFYRRSDATADSSFPSFKLVPNTDGKIILTVQQYIDGLLDYDLPSSGAVATAATRQSISFWIQTREVEDSSPATVAWITQESSNKRIALKMGMETNRYSRNNLLNYITSNKAFLTWQQSPRKVFDNQRLFLSFLNTVNTSANLSLFYTIKTIEGTTQAGSFALESLTGYILHLEVSIAKILAAATISITSGERLNYWEVKIRNTVTNTDITAVYRFYKDYKPVYHYYDFIYINSVGGVDTARAAGETTVSIDRTYDVAEGGFNANNWSDTVKANAIKQVNVSLQRKWKGDLGFRQDKAEQLGMMDLLLCLRSYMIVDGNWVPLLNIQASTEIHKTTDTKWGLPIEWQLAETNESYTPEYVVLGAGSDTETYNGSVFIINNSSTAGVTGITGIGGFAISVNPLLAASSPNTGVHTGNVTASSISVRANISVATTATLKKNDSILQTISLTNATYVSFTDSTVIGIADIIEIIIN